VRARVWERWERGESCATLCVTDTCVIERVERERVVCVCVCERERERERAAQPGA
jgi:hypothetical protein